MPGEGGAEAAAGIGVGGIQGAIVTEAGTGTATAMMEGGEEEMNEGEDHEPALDQRADLPRKRRPINLLLALHLPP